jgi:methylenetetrahydrofolate--tRNA-(uracil-5-)-methyltransferase
MPVTVVGGGLSGSEAAWQLAERGVDVLLVDMKPVAMSPAHKSPLLCELVCSNSLRSERLDTGAGLLKAELERLGSLVVAAARDNRVPAGDALGVDREGLGTTVTARLEAHPRIRIERRVVDEIPPGEVILATGPLTGGTLTQHIGDLVGGEQLYFYDAIAPIVAADSVAPEASFRQSRWDRDSPGDGCHDGEAGDYLNCPLTEAEYRAFVAAVRGGRTVTPHAFEEARYFEGCLPIEVMASRGEDTLRFGPMRPVGLVDPRTGRRPYAVVQLRPENQYRTAYNLVGFQTRLAYPEQKQIFALIPALRGAEFWRFGSIHRNTYLDSPRLLGAELELRSRPQVRFAGLLTGVEGYIESCAMGLLAARFVAARWHGARLVPPPPTTALGGLYHHVTWPRGPGQAFAPTNINFGLLPPLAEPHKKRDRKALMAARALRDLEGWLAAPGQAAA